MHRVVLLTGTCGSGKTTASSLLAERTGWVRLCEDDHWRQRFGKDRGPLRSTEHRLKRQQVLADVQTGVCQALIEGRHVVIDATVHEMPPEAFREYSTFFDALGITWALRVLHPRLEVAVARDACRTCWTVGADGVAELHAKFTGTVFAPECFLDNSDETPEQTVSRLLSIGDFQSNGLGDFVLSTSTV